MNTEKYKSVAVRIESYKKAAPMAKERYMSMGSFIRYLIDSEYERLNGVTPKPNGVHHESTIKKSHQ
jgi:hypothetical protein